MTEEHGVAVWWGPIIYFSPFAILILGLWLFWIKNKDSRKKTRFLTILPLLGLFLALINLQYFSIRPWMAYAIPIAKWLVIGLSFFFVIWIKDARKFTGVFCIFSILVTFLFSLATSFRMLGGY